MFGLKRECVLGLVAGVLSASSAHAQTIEYTVTLLGEPVPGAAMLPRSINNSGEVTGWFGAPGIAARAFLWTPAQGIMQLPSPPGNPRSYPATAISDTGLIAGHTHEAWRFDNGSYTIIGALPPDVTSDAWGINDAGDIVGQSRSDTIRRPNRAFLYRDGIGLIELAPADSIARDINNQGQVAGTTFVPGPERRAFRWTQAAGLEILPGNPGVSYWAAAINDNGQVVGEAFFSPNNSAAFIFTDGVGMRTIPGTNPRNAAKGINIQGHVVGQGTEGPIKGWIWTPQKGTRLLTDLIDPALQLQILNALDINDRGQIAATAGALAPGVEDGAVILTPIGLTCYPDCDGNGALDIFDFLCFQNSFVAGEPYACDCDTTGGPGVCDIFDFLCFQNALVAGCP